MNPVKYRDTYIKDNCEHKKRSWLFYFCLENDDVCFPGKVFLKYRYSMQVVFGENPQLCDMDKLLLLWYIGYSCQTPVTSMTTISKFFRFPEFYLNIFLPEKVQKLPLWCKYLFLFSGVIYIPPTDTTNLYTLEPEDIITVSEFCEQHRETDIIRVFNKEGIKEFVKIVVKVQKERNKRTLILHGVRDISTVEKFLKEDVWFYYHLFAFGEYKGDIPTITHDNQGRLRPLIYRLSDFRLNEMFGVITGNRSTRIEEIIEDETSDPKWNVYNGEALNETTLNVVDLEVHNVHGKSNPRYP